MLNTKAARFVVNGKHTAWRSGAALLGALTALEGIACSGPDCHELGTCAGAAVTSDDGGDKQEAAVDPMHEAATSDSVSFDSADVVHADADANADVVQDRGNGALDGGASQDACDGTVAADGACASPCTKTVCGQSCVDTDTDGANCARCGHDCLGGACTAGVCQPTAVVPKLGLPARMTIDATSVYWSAADVTEQFAQLIQKAPLAGLPQGTDPITLGSDLRDFAPLDLTILDNYVYWGNGDRNGGSIGQVFRVSTNTGVPQKLADTNQVFAIAADESGAYWSDSGGIYKAPAGMLTDGGTQITIAADSHTFDLAVDQGFVYWRDASTGIPYRAPRAGNGNKASLGGGQYQSTSDTINSRIALDADNLYWTDPDADRILKASLTGGQTVVVASLPLGSSPIGIAVDAQYVYWTTATTRLVMRAPIAGLAPGADPTTLVSNQVNPGDIAVNSDAVYWVEKGTSHAAHDGAIMKVAKP